MPKRKADNASNSVDPENMENQDFLDTEDDSEDDDIAGDSSKTDKYNMMLEDDIEGQEESTQQFDGEVQITPFNMKEEMEEGHFDKEGTYIFAKREKDEVKDHWLDNIDWVKVSSQREKNQVNRTSGDSDTSDDAEQLFDIVATYKSILDMLQPGETIIKALKRLGGSQGQKPSQRWKSKDKGTDEVERQRREQVSKLTELANSILSNAGNMDIYQESFEGIQFKLKKNNANASRMEADDELDMFAEKIDDKKWKQPIPSKESGSKDDEEPATKKLRFADDIEVKKPAENLQNDVLWEFKWKNEEAGDLHGPHTTSEMQNWVQEGYFESGVWVRRAGSQEKFYSSKRVDFELYL